MTVILKLKPCLLINLLLFATQRRFVPEFRRRACLSGFLFFVPFEPSMLLSPWVVSFLFQVSDEQHRRRTYSPNQLRRCCLRLQCQVSGFGSAWASSSPRAKSQPACQCQFVTALSLFKVRVWNPTAQIGSSLRTQRSCDCEYR
jgi:hypothetical protein